MPKRCGKCNKYKTYGEFYTRIDSGHYQSYCIECIKRYNQENREFNQTFKNEVYQDVCKNLPSEDQVVVVNMAKRFAGLTITIDFFQASSKMVPFAWITREYIASMGINIRVRSGVLSLSAKE